LVFLHCKRPSRSLSFVIDQSKARSSITKRTFKTHDSIFEAQKPVVNSPAANLQHANSVGSGFSACACVKFFGLRGRDAGFFEANSESIVAKR
jgi:hypothetical protein